MKFWPYVYDHQLTQVTPQNIIDGYNEISKIISEPEGGSRIF